MFVLTVSGYSEPIVVGDNLTLLCSTDDPEITFEWIYEEMIISEEPLFFIQNATEADSGTYTCRANTTFYTYTVVTREVPVFVQVLTTISNNRFAQFQTDDIIVLVGLVGGAGLVALAIIGVTVGCIIKHRSRDNRVRLD